MDIDYKAIGNRIRKLRTKRHETQENVSERAQLTPVHYSHIETGNTKASLPTFIKIANALEVGVDALLADNLHHVEHVSLQEMDELLADCTDSEAKALVKIAETSKMVLREMNARKL